MPKSSHDGERVTVSVRQNRIVNRTMMRAGFVILTALLVIILVSISSIGLGSAHISPGVIWQALVNYDAKNTDHIIVTGARIPRLAVGLAVGACLGVAGTLMQAITRNPLAAPGTLGINAGASFAVAVAIAYCGYTHTSAYVWFAFGGAAFTSVLVFMIGTGRGQAASPARLALAGTALAITIGAATAIIMATNYVAFNLYRFWVVGSVQGRGFGELSAVGPFMLVGLVCALLLSRSLNALSLSAESAVSLGANVLRTQLLAAGAVVLLAGSATAAAGPIAFIGLAAPHIVRLIVGPDFRYLLPCVMVVSPALLVGADLVAKTVIAPAELPTGVATAVFGGPIFVILVRSRKLVRL